MPPERQPPSRPPASAAAALVTGPGSWAAGKPMFGTAFAYGAAALDGKLFVVGGNRRTPSQPFLTDSINADGAGALAAVCQEGVQ